MEAHYEVTKPESNRGFAMAATLGVLTLLSVLVISIFANAMASFASGMTDLEKARTYFVAEAGAESAMAQLAVILEDALIEDSELSTITPPTIEGFTFDSFSVVRNGGIETEVITDGPFAGLFSLTQVVEITSIASSRDYTASAIMVTAKAQAIPIFQFGVFFDVLAPLTTLSRKGCAMVSECGKPSIGLSFQGLSAIPPESSSR